MSRMVRFDMCYWTGWLLAMYMQGSRKKKSIWIYCFDSSNIFNLKTGYYWTGALCSTLINDYTTSCASNTVYACNSTAGLYCSGTTCTCKHQFFKY